MNDAEAIRRRWSTHHDRGAHDYTDQGCRVLAEHAFRDIPVLLAALARMEARAQQLEEALRFWVDRADRFEKHLLPTKQYTRARGVRHESYDLGRAVLGGGQQEQA